MLDLWHVPSGFKADIQWFYGNANTVGTNWQTWRKPRGASMIYILMVGNGGGGGWGGTGAAATQGGGGGSSGTQSTVLVPAHLLPDNLFLSLAMGQGPNNTASSVASFASFIALAPVQNGPNQREVLCRAEGGYAGENDNPAGASVTATTLANMPLAGLGRETRLAGHAGSAGGAAGVGTNLALPTSGLIVTGGAGGAGAAGVAGNAGLAGGNITGAGVFNTIPGGAGGAATPTAGLPGGSGHEPFFGLQYGLGGSGGGSSGTAAGPTYALGGDGGAGAPGCGGGGGGGGSTGGTGGYGGPAFALIVAW